VVVTLTTSLVLALTLMPVMMVRWRKGGGRREEGRGGREEGGSLARPLPPPSSRLPLLDRMGHWCAERYEDGMKWALRHPRTVFLGSVITAVFTVWVATQLPREILPSVDEGTAVAQLTLPQGTAIEETVRQTARLEAAAKALGAGGIYARVGKATDEEILAGADPGTSATSQLLIPVPDGESGTKFAEALRKTVPDLSQGALAIDLAGQSEFGSLIGREGRLVRVEVSAPKVDEADRWADSVRTLLEPLKTLADIRDAFSTTQPTIEVTLERQRIAEYGLTVEAVANALAGGLGGVASGEFRETDRRTPIKVRFAGNANEDLATALATPLKGIPVGQLVSVKEIRAPVEVVRINQRPVSVIEAVVEKGGTARANRDVIGTLAKLSPPPGVTWQVAGADAEQQRTTRELSLVAILSAALMYLVLAGEFASFTTPMLVMLTVPLAAAGGLIFLWLTGQSLNAVSLIGIVVMIGMADNEAVVKLDAIRRFREQGHSIEEAILLGGRQRLRAIAMTSITTVTGVLPLLFNWGSGGALYQPLAAGIVGGSVTALAVTFFLLPTAYAWLERRKERQRASAPVGQTATAGGADLAHGHTGAQAH